MEKGRAIRTSCKGLLRTSVLIETHAGHYVHKTFFWSRRDSCMKVITAKYYRSSLKNLLMCFVELENSKGDE